MIVVTGASRGLGRAICDRFHARGEEVLGLARNVDGLPFPAIPCDIGSYDAVKSVATTQRRRGVRITGLVNAAGIASMNLAVTTPARVSTDIVQTNLLGTIFCCQLFAPIMLRHKAGAIINFSTIAVALGLKGESIYAASKAGVEAFSRTFAREMAEFNITVNCIAPGPIQTDLLKGVTPAQIERIVARQVIPRQFDAAAICDVVELLLDERGRSLSGQVFHVGGV